MEPAVVMVVDDDEAIREALCDLLQDEGYRVIAVADGKEALARLSDGARPDVILLDLMMPVLDGWKFRAEQIVNPAFASIPIIVITAVTAAEKWGSLGVAVYTKPLDMPALLVTIREQCARVRDQRAPATSASSPLRTASHAL